MLPDDNTAETATPTPSSDETQPTPPVSKWEESAAWHLPSHLRLWLVAAIGLALDLWTKHLAFTRIDPNPTDPATMAIPGLVSLRRSLNPGALFGLGKGLTPVFIAASILALGFVFFLFVNSSRKRRSLHVALALVLAGALGNLYDRAFMIADVVKYTAAGRQYTVVGKIVNPGETPIRLGAWPEGKHPRIIPPQANPEVSQKGVVRDFVKMEPSFKIAGYQIDIWPWVFNVADVLLVWGVAILMLNFWWERKAEEAAKSAPSADPNQPASDPATPA